MGVARWIDEHNRVTMSAAPGTFSLYAYAVAASIVVVAAFIALVRLRHIRVWPGLFFALLGIEALVATVFQPPGPIEKATVLALGVILCIGEIRIVQESGRRMERDSEQKQNEIRTSFIALKDALTAQFQMEALEIKAGLEKHLLDMRMAADQTDKALISHQLWDLVAHVSGLAQRYFKKAAEAQSIPAHVMGADWLNEKARRESRANFEATQALKDYNQDRYNQVVSMRNTLKEKYDIGSKEFDETLERSKIDLWSLAQLAFYLNWAASELRSK
jgi:hypothetical protein